MASLNDIRASFIDYFVQNDHKHISSSSLVPENDPSLMFTNAGMVQFKNVFTGHEKRDYLRAVTSQKSVRAGGKHNDLDNVGYTARHHTFFEMLGNFSFGDYFKEEAIPLAWNLVTKEFGLPKDKLLVTIYHTDDEAAELWKKVAGLSDDKIIRIATSDNFWQMGATGPCGPCSEIFYDHGEQIWGGPPGSAEEDGDRFIEIWNLVFMQQEKFEDGSEALLPRPSIDTGMGLERIGAILQGQHDNYDTDLFKSLIEASAHVTNVEPYGDQNVHHRVIADHLRSTSFLLADGVMPSNEGRGYVLRRIMRRAMRHAHLLGAKEPVMHKLVPALVQQMGGFYPELTHAQTNIEDSLLIEETRFRQTLDRGLRLLDDELEKLPSGQDFPGEIAFKLYDTYGFPLDLTQDALREKQISVDLKGFDAAMQDQKNKARAAWSGSGATADAPIWFELADELGSTEFLGYQGLHSQAHILALLQDDRRTDVIKDEGIVIVNQSPFYAESGGQIGDQGEIVSANARAKVLDTRKIHGVFAHFVKMIEGEFQTADVVDLQVDAQRRQKIRMNHSATHILHEALRNHLGDHVAQRGSLNADTRLRFDFSHDQALTAEEIEKVTQEVNMIIRQNSEVVTRIMHPDDARALGAQALFGEKYGDEVRVVSMGVQEGSGKGLDKNSYSLELCGGTHVQNTGEIGAFMLLSDSASSAGVRRIEAITGEEAVREQQNLQNIINDLSLNLKAKPDEVLPRLLNLQSQLRTQSQEIADLKRKLATSDGGVGQPNVETIGEYEFLARQLSGVSGKELPAIIDELRDKISNGVVAVFAENDGRVAAAIAIIGQNALNAKDLLAQAVPLIGGKGGGGRDNLAQGGGNDASGIDKAVEAIKAAMG